LKRYLCDTSCLIAAVCSWHQHHPRTRKELQLRAADGEELVLAAHSLAETYAVLTRLPPPHRLRASDALAVLQANWAQTKTAHLTAAETWRGLNDAERRGITGGQTYDALIAVSARKAGAQTLLTWNLRNFVPFQNELEVLTPR
jgi:predicted nucleic acid-binding protein